MKKKTPQILKAGTMAVCIGLFSVAITGCKKEEEDQTAKFNGTWTGTASCNGGSGGTGQLVFTATDKKTITTTYSAGSTAACTKAAILTGTASGNTMTFPTTTITDNCGLSYSINGSGTLNGGTLTFTFSVNGAANGQCTFTGTK